MASNVDIANAALTKIGAARILTLTDNTKSAREVNSMFTRIRDSELRKHLWRFSIKRAQLAAQVTAPLFGFLYAYRPPTDNLRLVQVGDYYPAADLSNAVVTDESEYSFENGLILCDYAAPLNVRYVAAIDDPTVYDANFVEVFACALAVQLAEPITQAMSKREAALAEYKMALRDALRANAIEVVPTTVADDTFIVSRL